MPVIFVSGDVTTSEVSEAQARVASRTAPDNYRVQLVPTDLQMGFDLALASSVVSTLTAIAAFVHSFVQDSSRQRTAAQGSRDDRADTSGTIQAPATNRENEWEMRVRLPDGFDLDIGIRQQPNADFHVRLRRIKN